MKNKDCDNWKIRLEQIGMFAGVDEVPEAIIQSDGKRICSFKVHDRGRYNYEITIILQRANQLNNEVKDTIDFLEDLKGQIESSYEVYMGAQFKSELDSKISALKELKVGD